MLGSTAVFVLAFACATISDVQAARAVAIVPPDPHSLPICGGCAGSKDDDLRKDLDQPVSLGSAISDIGHADLLDSPGGVEELLSVEGFTTEIAITESMEATSPVRDWGSYQRSDLCNYVGSELHDPRRAEEECGAVEPGSDYFELISVLTLTTTSALFFALAAAVWLLHRSYRNRLLRNIASQRPMTRARSRKRRRRVSNSRHA